MKDRTLLFSALVAIAIHGLLLFLNLGMTKPSLASVESTIEVTLVGPPDTPSVAEPAAEPVPPPEPETEPETVEVVESPPEPEPVIETPPEPEPASELEPPEEIEPPTKPPAAKLVEKTQYVVHPVESASTGKPSDSSSHEQAPAEPMMGQPAGGAVAQVDLAPAYMYNPKPPYPRAARRLGQEGKVLLLVEVRASGRVGRVEIETSSGYDILDNAAVKAVRKWRFSPAKVGRRPVPAWVKIPVEFDLRTEE